VSHSFFLSPSRTPKVNIVLPLSLVWQDKADTRWSHVSTSHDRRNRGKAHWAVEAERKSNIKIMFLCSKLLQKPWVTCFLCNKGNCILAEQSQNVSPQLDIPLTLPKTVFLYDLMSSWPVSTWSNLILPKDRRRKHHPVSPLLVFVVLFSRDLMFWHYCLL